MLGERVSGEFDDSTSEVLGNRVRGKLSERVKGVQLTE